MNFILFISTALFYASLPCEANIFDKIILAIQASFTETDVRNQTTFHLYTRKNPTTGQILDINNATSFTSSNFNSELQTRIIIHGFQAGGNSKMAKLIRDAYLKKDEFNVIAIDWSPIARKINYNYVVKNIKSVAEIVAQFLMALYKIYMVPFHNIYLIGHSLGAQMAGMIGQLISPHQVNTIFALDPARPKFEGINIEDRVDMTDAAYVESIHTNINDLGYKEPVGHGSFYPNYGGTQPGCNFSSCLSVVTCKYGCSHRRAYEYFAESINETKGFLAQQCNEFDEILKSNCSSNSTDYFVTMGGEPSVPKSGIFYLSTESTSPFAKGLPTL